VTLEILNDKYKIGEARHVLVSRGVSLIESPLISWMRKYGLAQGMAIGDMLKSWDVLSTINFLDTHVSKNDPILDIGCYASELIVALYKLGYSNLTGADINPKLQQMPYRDVIHYDITDFMHTKFEDTSFQAITAISVIEHGFDGQSLLKEMTRLLNPYGYFIASFDYWPDKIDTTGVKFFGMDWIIFSADEVKEFVSEAANYGLFPIGGMKYGGKDKPIHCGGKEYTFAWLVLQKQGQC